MDAALICYGVFGLFLGCVVGMTSIGTGLIGTPGLLLLGLSGPVAVGTIGTAGVCMMTTSAVKHYRNDNVHLPTVVAFLTTSVPFSFFFARYKERINAVIELRYLIAVAILLSVCTLTYKFFVLRTNVEDYENSATKTAGTVALGMILSFFIGVTSISGSLVVISLMLILKMPERMAIGTTNFVAIFSLAAASVAHVANGNVDWGVLAIFTPCVMVGAYFGAHFANAIPKRPLQIIILCLLLIAAIGIFVRNGNEAKRVDGISTTKKNA